MKGATLRQRPFCGVALRHGRPAPARPGVLVRVFVPSKDNASGSSDKVPMRWTSLNHKVYLEEVYSRDAAEPDYRVSPTSSTAPSDQQAPPAAPQQQQQQQQQSGEEVLLLDPQQVLAERTLQQEQQQQPLAAPRLASYQPVGDQACGEHLVGVVLDPDHTHALQERLASSFQASTSSSTSSSSQSLYINGSTGGSSSGAKLNGASPLRGPSRKNGAAAAAVSASGGFATGAGRGAAATLVVAPEEEQQPQQQQAVAGTAAGGSGSSCAGGQQGTTPPAVSWGHAGDHHHRHDSHHHDSHHHHDSNNGHHHHHDNHNHHHQQLQQQQLGHQLQLHLAQEANGASAATTTATVVASPPQRHEQQQQEQHQLNVALSSLLGPPEGTQALADAVEAASNGSGSSAPPPAPTATATTTAAADPSIPKSIWILCCISAALTCASCVFNTALPIYMVSELKMSMRSMGMFEGLLEAFSYVVRMCSGVVSDRMTSRKAAITLGFAAGAAAKFGMAGAGTVGLLFAGKAVDRLANGIQAAPRDALIGDLSPSGVRSACFGLAQSLRKWGSAVGALAAFFLMKASNNNYQLIFYSAATVSLTACLAFVLFVPAHTRPPSHREQQQQQALALAQQQQQEQARLQHSQQQQQQPHHSQQQQQASPAVAAAAAAVPPAPGPLSGLREFLRSVRGMGSDFYRMLGVISLYALGHVNESLLEARAMEVGFGKAEATLVVAAIAAVTFLTAFPLGKLDDKYGAGTTFAVGIGALIAGDLVLLLSGQHPMALFAACLFLGVHWAVIQGPLLSIVSGLAPGHLRGTAFGIFYTVMAVTAVAANTMYGTIWHMYGANAAFATSAALMTAVLVALPHMLPASASRKPGPQHQAAAVVVAPAVSVAPVVEGPGKGPAGGLVPVVLPAAA